MLVRPFFRDYSLSILLFIALSVRFSPNTVLLARAVIGKDRAVEIRLDNLHKRYEY
jgi:hypothetical protein